MNYEIFCFFFEKFCKIVLQTLSLFVLLSKSEYKSYSSCNREYSLSVMKTAIRGF